LKGLELNKYIESTSLDLQISPKDVENLLKVAIDKNFHGVCIPPFWVKKASRDRLKSPVNIITVIGYPLGFDRTETKLTAIDLALEDGADEIDLVINYSSFVAGMNWTKIEMAKCASVVHNAGRLLKVIVETDLWGKEDLVRICQLASDAGVDFIKTSTGYHRTPVTPELVETIKKHIPSNVGIKASGGIKTKELAMNLIKAGAERIGTSSPLELIE
jgi:deoxyribose-phosphate aldolase